MGTSLERLGRRSTGTQRKRVGGVAAGQEAGGQPGFLHPPQKNRKTDERQNRA